MIYGYIRVSSDKQTVENQRFEINNFCSRESMTIDGWIEETISGTKNYNKRQLGKLLKRVQKDDLIICAELSRLGRNLFMIMEILNICMTKECRVWTIKDNYRLGEDIQSKVLAFAFGLSAEIERNLISQRTKEALARKKSEGVILGRPKGRKNAPDKYKLSGKETLITELIAIICLVLTYLLYSENKKRTKLFEDYCEMKARVEMAAESSQQSANAEDTDARQKPVSVESIRTALRFNGISPEIPDTHDPNYIYFKIGDTKYRINAEHLPYMSIESGFGLKDEPRESTNLMYKAAADITSQMYIGKAYLMGDAEAIIFSVELLCDSYMHLRNNLKQYLDLLSEVSKRFAETHEALKERQKKEAEEIFSGRSFITDRRSNKVQS